MKSLRACAGVAAMIVGLWLGVGAVDAASAEKGKAAFMKFGCWECHGTAGQGTIAGPKLAPDPLPFDTLASFVRTTSRLMPPYRETVLPNEDLADIYAYLQSIPKAPDYKSLPLLAQ
jgi:ubiquinol-cytochrome c reductase cytochrome c subunit